VLGDAAVAQRFAMLGEVLEIIRADALGLGDQRILLLESVETPDALEGKIDLLGIEGLHQEHVVAAVAQAA
jgi:hypothetical protein